MPTQRPFAQYDFSGALQVATSRLLRKDNEVALAKNAAFNIKIGSMVRRSGYEQVGETIANGKDALFGGVFKSGTKEFILASHNNSGDTNSVLRHLDNGGYWTDIATDLNPNSRLTAANHLDELYIAGGSLYGEYIESLRNVDGSKNVSTSHNVYGAPKSRYIIEFQGKLYAFNVELNGTKYPDRIYQSSAPTGAITFVQRDQKGVLLQLTVDSVRYLKAGMTVDIYSAGTEAKVVSSLPIISVNKNKNIITFAATSIDVKDNDEIWLTGTKGKLSVYWNTDYPTNETADFIRIPPGLEQIPNLRGAGKSNNRLFFFTANSMWKWDGANFVNVSPNVGCVSHESIGNIGNWLIWLHSTGVWGYNDTSGRFELLSRGIQPYTNAITNYGLRTASAVVNGRVYKLSVGELRAIDSNTTSTSTSSTSTSSTSSSTSSTSTSSTSTSSTSTSTSISSTSTSSTSVSTSSTSISTSSTSTSSTSVSTSSTSTSMSTSTSSTSTSTIASTKNVVRLIYDFDMNSWWTEYHKREMRYQFMYTRNGITKPFFVDETGRLFQDETGYIDHHDTIPMDIETGRNTLGSRYIKRFTSVLIQSESARGTQVMASVDGGQWQPVGQIQKDIETLIFNANFPQGHDISYKFIHNDDGAAPSIDGIETFSSIQESKVA